MGDIYENIKKYNSNKECKIFIVFYDIFADMPSNKKLQQIVIKLFIRFRKLRVSLVFITQSYFTVPKYIRLNSPQYFIMKILNKWELQQTAINHLSGTEF